MKNERRRDEDEEEKKEGEQDEIVFKDKILYECIFLLLLLFVAVIPLLLIPRPITKQGKEYTNTHTHVKRHRHTIKMHHFSSSLILKGKKRTPNMWI